MEIKDIKELQSLKVEIDCKEGKLQGYNKDKYKNFPKKITLLGMFSVYNPKKHYTMPVKDLLIVDNNGLCLFHCIDTNFPDKVLNIRLSLNQRRDCVVYFNDIYPLDTTDGIFIGGKNINRTRLPKELSSKLKEIATLKRKEYYSLQKKMDKEYIKMHGKSIYGTKIPDKYYVKTPEEKFDILKNSLPKDVKDKGKISGSGTFYERKIINKKPLSEYNLCYNSNYDIIEKGKEYHDEELDIEKILNKALNRNDITKKDYILWENLLKVRKKYSISFQVRVAENDDDLDYFDLSYVVFIMFPKKLDKKFINEYLKIITSLNEIGLYK